MNWKKVPASRWGLRQLGVMLLLAAYVIVKHLLILGALKHGDQPPLVYFLAMIAFLCGSAGSALLVHGHHLFDQIEVSERWRRKPPPVPELASFVSTKEPEIEAEKAARTVSELNARSDQSPVTETPRFRIL